jgi:Ca-activated chloride channel family protein
VSRKSQCSKNRKPGEANTINAHVAITSNLVTVNVIVTDRKGSYVKGLNADQFSIYDENIKQNIAHFSVGAAPVSIGIVCETPVRLERTATILAALKQFVSTLGQHDTFFFTAYSRDGSVTTDFIPSAAQLTGHLSAVKPGGPSALYDALFSGADKLRQAPNLKRALLVVSDGQDNSSKHTYDDLRNRLREFDVQIYTIAIADKAMDQFAGSRRWMFEDLTRQTGRRSFPTISEAGIGQGVLAEMSRVSGGATYSAESESEPELTWICAQIATELREQYTLGFYPSQVSPQRWHKLKVHIATQQLKLSLSYRKGYQFATKKSISVGHVNVWQAPF